ncbi:MAG: spore germination protein GerW family protein [Ktedonobacteraceae bacterium]
MNTNIGHEADVERSGRGGTFLERFANRVGNSARASTIFAEPVERNGVTVILVAKARWGVGGGAGSGRGEKPAGEDMGGGAGVSVTPVGYVELKDGKARFRPIYDPGLLLQLIIGLGFVAMLVLRGVRKLVRS